MTDATDDVAIIRNELRVQTALHRRSGALARALASQLAAIAGADDPDVQDHAVELHAAGLTTVEVHRDGIYLGLTEGRP